MPGARDVREVLGLMPGDPVSWTEHRDGEVLTYTFAGGLVTRAEVPGKDDALRILPLTRVQAALLRRLAQQPSLVRGKRVFEPFAGSGALGFMALHLGARSVDFLDINPRAEAFQRWTAAANGFPEGTVRSLTADLRTHPVAEPYDLILANPPFLPTPDCVPGTLTSNGGPDGSRLLALLLDRLDAFLTPEGEAQILLYQPARDGVPIVAEVFAESLAGRVVEFTALQRPLLPFPAYRAAYERRYPAERARIRQWAAALEAAHGPDLTVSYYLMRLGPRTALPGVAPPGPAAVRFVDGHPDHLLTEDDVDYVPVDGRRR
ncbi:methyltransferase [Streptomyces sp. NPDC048506]|uniref:methyltransferase n=1 Tax=Streptomyces sp. NPDC048506 TaxID=3155028 RepID=UPI0034332AFF